MIPIKVTLFSFFFYVSCLITEQSLISRCNGSQNINISSRYFTSVSYSSGCSVLCTSRIFLRQKKESLRWKLHNEKLKEKIKNYREDLKVRRQELMDSMNREQKLTAKKERARNKYFSQQKQRILEYHQKKDIITKITGAHIDELVSS